MRRFSRPRAGALILLAAALLIWTAFLQAASGGAPARVGAQADAAASSPGSAESRAVAYLAVEVPRWREAHPCYSCHNNGDGTRALLAASRLGLVEAGRFAGSIDWLRTPEQWVLNADDGGVKDLPLARIQFASALRVLVEAEPDQLPALQRAAALVIADQQADGSWPINTSATIGSPAGYGPALATAMAKQLLVAVPTPDARQALARADAWFRAAEPASVLDASAVLLGLGTANDAAAAATRTRGLTVLRQGQAPDGGWGPYTTSPSEPFDTALAVLALEPLLAQPALAGPVYDREALRAAIAQGRAYLRGSQYTDGSWTETTRPSGQESYAQRISTTAWALVALLGGD